MKHSREPVEHTCPDIDKLIKKCDRISEYIRYATKSDDLQELKDAISDIDNDFWDFDIKLEELRLSNDSLRNWGIEEAEKVDDFELEEFKVLTDKEG